MAEIINLCNLKKHIALNNQIVDMARKMIQQYHNNEFCNNKNEIAIMMKELKKTLLTKRSIKYKESENDKIIGLLIRIQLIK